MTQTNDTVETIGWLDNWDREDPTFEGRITAKEVPSEFAQEAEMIIESRMLDPDMTGNPLMQKCWLRKTEGDHYQILINGAVIWTLGQLSVSYRTDK